MLSRMEWRIVIIAALICATFLLNPPHVEPVHRNTIWLVWQGTGWIVCSAQASLCDSMLRTGRYS